MQKSRANFTSLRQPDLVIMLRPAQRRVAATAASALQRRWKGTTATTTATTITTATATVTTSSTLPPAPPKLWAEDKTSAPREDEEESIDRSLVAPEQRRAVGYRTTPTEVSVAAAPGSTTDARAAQRQSSRSSWWRELPLPSSRRQRSSADVRHDYHDGDNVALDESSDEDEETNQRLRNIASRQVQASSRPKDSGSGTVAPAAAGSAGSALDGHDDEDAAEAGAAALDEDDDYVQISSEGDASEQTWQERKEHRQMMKRLTRDKEKRRQTFMPPPDSSLQEDMVVDVRIDRLDQHFIGHGMYGNSRVAAQLTLPGELVRVRVHRYNPTRKLFVCDLVQLLEPSPDRVQPPCKYFGDCNGCQLQHYPYEKQIKWKASIVERLFRDSNVAVRPIKASPIKYHYRSKLSPSFMAPPPGSTSVDIGFHSSRNHHKIVDVDRCLIATESINKTMTRLRAEINDNIDYYIQKQRGSTLFLRDSLATTKDGQIVRATLTDPNAFALEQVGDKYFRFTANSFFQNNSFMLKFLAEYVIKMASGEGIEYLVDTYCGAGLFAIYGADKFQSITGIDISSESIRCAVQNAKVNMTSNKVNFMQAEAQMIFNDLRFPSDRTTVVMDPPHAGCSVSFLKQLILFRPRRIVYVSCNPFSQKRDIQWLNNAHTTYKIMEIQPLDMFPQTTSIENIITLEREDYVTKSSGSDARRAGASASTRSRE